MATTNLNKVVNHAKAAWGVSTLLAKLAAKAFSHLRIKQSYGKRIKALEDERDAKLAKNLEVQEKLVEEMMVSLGGPNGGLARGLKSVTYTIGQVGFRQMKPSVELADGFTKQDLVAKFERRHHSWLRFKPEINKQAILADFHDGKFKKVEGFSIKQGEEFFVSLAPRGKEKPEIITVELPKK